MRKSVYIETTIPSFYYTKRTDTKSIARMSWTRQWWDLFSGEFNLVSSAAVVNELRRGSSDMVSDRIRLLGRTELLPITDEIRHIAHIYIDNLVMPKDPAGDALHLAITTFHKVDVLLTWNCAHIANPNKIDRIHVINYKIGFQTPSLMTPLNYLSGDEDD
jgi:hypothetical protein